MSYETAVASMFALGHELANTPSHKFDLAHMRVLLRALDHPERTFPSVLIAGTNGKGSTAATLASILRASGLKTGFIPPRIWCASTNASGSTARKSATTISPGCMAQSTESPSSWSRQESCRGIPVFSK